MSESITRVGETSKASNGMMMTIIAYRKYNDIDIQFEDGTIVCHRRYNTFLNGGIRYPVDKLHIGETYTNRVGLKMTIIAYRDFTDADVMFEDGTIVCHKRYQCIVEGQVANPNIQFGNGRIKSKYHNRIGETSVALNGQKMVIINYRRSIDLDVEFDDGTKVYHVEYKKFKDGCIKNPNARITRINNIVGTDVLMKNGLHAVVTDYRGTYEVSLKFETGYVTDHKTYRNFRVGKVSHPFPYVLGDITIESPAYTFNKIGNFYCRCNKCGLKDIMTIREIKEHICNK